MRVQLALHFILYTSTMKVNSHYLYDYPSQYYVIGYANTCHIYLYLVQPVALLPLIREICIKKSFGLAHDYACLRAYIHEYTIHITQNLV